MTGTSYLDFGPFRLGQAWPGGPQFEARARLSCFSGRVGQARESSRVGWATESSRAKFGPKNFGAGQWGFRPDGQAYLGASVVKHTADVVMGADTFTSLLLGCLELLLLGLGRFSKPASSLA